MATFLQKISRRLKGLPRSLREIDRSLSLLATLRALGWHRSIGATGPVDHLGAPLPWFTYPAIEWLEPRLSPTLRVFEFGAGHSTLWLARLGLTVISVEDDAMWARHLRELLPGNATILLLPAAATEESPFVKSICQFEPHSYDMIVIDGQQRSACARTCLPYLKPEGLIVFDNSDRPENLDGVQALHAAGLHRIDFVGITPGYGHFSCTSFFSRSQGQLTRKDGYPRFLGG